MESIILGEREYQDKVKACWLGKNIGGTLGAPYECRKYTHLLTFFDPVPTEPLPNDDLDFQLVWLKMLEDRGIHPTFTDFADYWLKYLSKHWYNEYSLCTYNLRRGLRPPISGAFQNYWVDEMGSPIRSEIWACVAPANPQLASQLAWMDSSLDHTGGEGRWGEMFWASAESAAFVVKDERTLINIGLSMIPISCNIARVIREAIWCFDNGLKWGEARERIATIFGHHQPCNAIPNHGFTIIGLLYGKDFGDKLCKAVNCGYDTDCTGATLGSLLGIMYGTAYIPSEWKKPVGKTIKPCKFTVTTGLPLTIQDLTERTVKIAKTMTENRSASVKFGPKTSLSEGFLSFLYRNLNARSLLSFDNHCAVENMGELEVIFHYGGEPVLYPKITRIFEVTVCKNGKPIETSLRIKVPKNWKVSRGILQGNHYQFEVTAQKVANRNVIEIFISDHGRVKFTVLGPGQAKPLPAATNAPTADSKG